MRYTILAFAVGAAAVPLTTTTTICPNGLYSNPQCCATDVLGAIGLNCGVPATTPANTDEFISVCASAGQQAKCCVIPVADQDLLCQDVSPGSGGDNGGGSPGSGSPTPTKSSHPSEPTDCGCDDEKAE